MKILTKEQSFSNFLLFAIFAMFLNMATSYIGGYATIFSVSVYIIGIALQFAFILLYAKGHEFTAKVLSTFFFNIFFFIFSYYYGLRSLVLIYYFPFIVSFIYMFRNSATHAQAKAFVYTCFVFVVATVLICSTTGVKTLTEAQVTTMCKKNFIVPFVLSAYYFYCIFNFLMKQKEMAEEASKSKARFLSIMSHELRTPLNGIISSINLMDTSTNETERQRFTKVLQSSSQHLLHLVNNVLDYSKASSGKMELNPVPCSIAEIIDNLKAVFQSRYDEKGLVFEVQTDKKLKQTVLLDDVRLVQVLTNLLSNALKFTDEGKVTLAAKCINKTDSNIELEISVTDTGKGLSKEQQSKIFESFNNISNKSRTLESTGLGLSISKMIVEMMDSKLCIDSEVNKGSRFYFTITLPFAEIKQPGSSGNYINEISLEGMNVLIAEDNPINMMVAKEFLKRWKVNIREAKNGKIAQQVLLEHNDVDLLLLDLQMPEMNGYELMEWINTTELDLPVIAFTAEIMANEEKNDLFNRGFDDLVPKPFAPEELQNKMKTCLQKKRNGNAIAMA